MFVTLLNETSLDAPVDCGPFDCFVMLCCFSILLGAVVLAVDETGSPSNAASPTQNTTFCFLLRQRLCNHLTP